MIGKHANALKHWVHQGYRDHMRWRLRNLVAWDPLDEPEPGCTAIIGVCSRLPAVLGANLRCLYEARWPALKRVIAVVDDARPPDTRPFPSYRGLDIQVVHYSGEQKRVAERLSLPYVYAWLSWCIGLAHVRTEHVLIHDYDALILSQALGERYDTFRRSGAKVQGIRWYVGNGVMEQDRLATTFEAFFDTRWLRALEPIELFHKLRIKNGRSIDFDITLDAQDRLLPAIERDAVAMSERDLVHPTQMIHQYTMFRRQPNAALPCFSIPMIPFFCYLSGDASYLERSAQAIDGDDFLGDGTRVNFERLTIGHVDWALKQMVRAALGLRLRPDPLVYDYGRSLYRHIGADDRAWIGDFDPDQRRWIEEAGTRTVVA